MQYQEAVQEARQLVKRSEDDQYRLAELTWEQVEGGIAKKQWARDIGRSPKYVRVLYKVWAEYGGGDTRPPFSEAYERCNSPERYEGVEAEDLWKTAHQENARGAIRNLPPERKAEVARELVADLPAQTKAEVTRELLAEPKVAEVAMRDDETSVNVAAARAKHVQQRNERQDEAARIRAPELYDASDLAEVGNNLAHISSRLELLAQQLQKIPTAKRGQFTRLWDEIKQHVGWVESVMTGDDIDEGFAKLLEGGDQR